MLKNSGNIFAALPEKTLPKEIIEPLLQSKDFKLERIISTGQITPEGEWYDQAQDEWVILLIGVTIILLGRGEFTLFFKITHHISVSCNEPKSN